MCRYLLGKCQAKQPSQLQSPQAQGKLQRQREERECQEYQNQHQMNDGWLTTGCWMDVMVRQLDVSIIDTWTNNYLHKSPVTLYVAEHY